MQVQRGFTLIELMVTIMIMGILAALALPSYSDYVRRTNRAVAKTVLMQVVAKQESFLADRKSYATALSALSYPADTFYFGKNGSPTTSTSGAMYSVTIEAGATATTYTVSATAYSSQQLKDTRCKTLSVNSLGVRSALNSSGTSTGTEDCWTR